MTRAMREVSLLWIMVFALLLGHYALAQSLDDFKEAATNDGCKSIPYPDLRDKCNDKQQYVHTGESCDGKRSCRGLETQSFERLIAGATANREDLKQRKADLDNQKSELASDDDDVRNQLQRDIDKIQSQIDAAQSNMDAWKTRIDNNKAAISERITRGEKCQDARQQVQDVFKDAMSKAKDESDADIKPFAEQLVDKWDASGRTHEDELKNVIDVTNKCKELR